MCVARQGWPQSAAASYSRYMAINGAPDAERGGMKQLALRERHEALGARFAPFAGWEMPLQYQGIVAEHEAVRGSVGVFDVSHLARAWVRGPGAAELLRSVTTFDVTTVPVGQGALLAVLQRGRRHRGRCLHLPPAR